MVVKVHFGHGLPFLFSLLSFIGSTLQARIEGGGNNRGVGKGLKVNKRGGGWKKLRGGCLWGGLL